MDDQQQLEAAAVIDQLGVQLGRLTKDLTVSQMVVEKQTVYISQLRDKVAELEQAAEATGGNK
jgi:hypothetical protein